MSDWNAARYHDVSTPQQTWGRRILDRLELTGRERALDLGCGTGRLTSILAGRLRDGRVTGLDRSATMIDAARAWLRESGVRVGLVLADGDALPFGRSFDLVFSAATFHWIHDHAALFESILHALEPGGRLVAQCGGGANLALLHERASALMQEPRFASAFEDWHDPWYFAGVAETTRRLSAAGFVDIDVSLEAAPTPFSGADEYSEFISTVCVRHHLNRLKDGDRGAYLASLTKSAAADDPPFTLDYWRLNVSARRPL